MWVPGGCAWLLWPLLLLSCWQIPCRAWDNGDLELFDLVEEIQQNFYQFLGVEQDASSADIRKAYRKLSLTLHPDKNKEENAETQFRQLVAIYEVLKDEERRQRYDDILVNGLPDWRQPVFYYRRVRKMSNAELALLLFIIFTVGHYAVVWSIYLEKQLDELLSKKKKEKRKKAGGKSLEEVKSGLLEKNERVLEKPQWRDVLPFKLGIWFYLTVKSLPQLFQDAKQFYSEYNEKKMKEKEEAEAQAELEAILKEKKPKVKKNKSEFPVYPVFEPVINVQSYDQGVSIEEIEEQMDDWLENRNRMQKKKVTTKSKQMKDSVSHSSGTLRHPDLKCTAKMSVNISDSLITQREDDEPHSVEWDLSACPSDCLVTAARARKRKSAKATEAGPSTKEEAEDKFKGRRQRDFDDIEQDAEELVDSDDESRKKERGRVLEELWTQNQQKLLELALQQYPKGTAERWDKIAKCVPAKTKEECISRYKLLVELVQKKKQSKS
ncbi:dnaJ homolog subfamily C member 1 isoform X4 [Ascaphus truei]|uniref:dnaJ homolog subfamily C member 1 isoform X4 n=1 Tax=Ascaphus truei TaxID=8439 RepID=UPI003F597B07